LFFEPVSKTFWFFAVINERSKSNYALFRYIIDKFKILNPKIKMGKKA